MSSRDLKFPSGRTIKNAKKDAKKLAKAENIKLAEAQRRIATKNGIDLPWNQALNLITDDHDNAVFRAPDGTMLPFVPLSDAGITWHNQIIGTSGKGKSAFDEYPEYAHFMLKSHKIDNLVARYLLGWVQHEGDNRRTWYDRNGHAQHAICYEGNHPYVMDAHLDDPWWEVCAFQPSSNAPILEQVVSQITDLGFTYELTDDGKEAKGFFRGDLIIRNTLSERVYLVTNEFLVCRTMVATALALKADPKLWDSFLEEWVFNFDSSFLNLQKTGGNSLY